MARKRYTAKEIIGHLRTLEIEVGKGVVVGVEAFEHDSGFGFRVPLASLHG